MFIFLSKKSEGLPLSQSLQNWCLFAKNCSSLWSKSSFTAITIMVQTSLMTPLNSSIMFMKARDVNNLLADDWHMHLVHQYFKVFLIFPFLRNLILVKFFNFVSSYQIHREVTTNKSNRCLGVLIAPLWRWRRKILKKLIYTLQTI